MRYSVQFQELKRGALRPIDHPSASDHTIENGNETLLPNIGDHVFLEPMGDRDAPRYDGKVRSRLFSYFGDKGCNVTIVVEEMEDESEWGKLIKE